MSADLAAPLLHGVRQVWALRNSFACLAGVDSEFVRDFYRSAAARCYILRQWLESGSIIACDCFFLIACDCFLSNRL